jgi:hypothetical protein
LVKNTPVPAWSLRLIDDLDRSDRRTADLTHGLDSSQLNWRPAPEAWSIGQCLQHLLGANEVYLPPMAKALDGQAEAPVEEITPGWFGRWFIRSYIEPSSVSRRARSPRKIAPVERVEADVVDRFLRSNAAARDLIRRASTYDVNRIRFVNPFVPVIRFTVGTGLKIICRHEHRHLLQAERVRQDARFPKESRDVPGPRS